MDDNRTTPPAPLQTEPAAHLPEAAAQESDARASSQVGATGPVSIPESQPAPPEPAARGAWWLLFGVALPGAALCAVLRLTLWPVSAVDTALNAVWISAGALAGLAALCAVWALLGGRRLPGPFWAGVSGVYCIWLVFGVWALDWALFHYDTDLLLVACSLVMTIIIASMLRVVRWLTPPGKRHSVGKPFLSLLGLPVIYYLFIAMMQYSYYAAWSAILLVLSVALTYGFVLLLLRTMYLTMLARESGRVLRAIVALVLPLLGLLVSQLTPLSSFFYDFSSPVYYLLAAANGVLLLVREPQGPLRLALHFARGTGTLFALYFFFCLSPFYALSLVGMIALGAGLLVLAPVFLLLYQGRVILAASRRLRADYGRLTPAIVFLLGMALLPTCLVLSFSRDRGNIETALAYVQGTADEDAGQVNISSLENSLYYMTLSGRGGHTPAPLLPAVYSRTVAGSRQLSESSYQRIRALFFNDGARASGTSATSSRRSGTPTVVVTDIEVETVQQGEDYRSTLHFTIENTGTGDNAEYATAFRLPEGVYISGYYLDVLGERKQGLMTVREAAVWIYERTVSQARDPGILYYDGGEIVFRVFPFEKGEVRQTGIELLHRDKVHLEIAGRELTLAPDAPRLTEPIVADGAAYFSTAAKLELAAAARRPQYIFVVDCSTSSANRMQGEQVEQFCEDYGIATADAVVMAQNYRSETWPMSGDWQQALERFPREGGFDLAAAVAKAFSTYSTEQTYPVVVAVSNTLLKALLPEKPDYAADLCPEMDGYLQLSGDGLLLHRFSGDAPEHFGALMEPQAALSALVNGERVFLRNNGLPQVVSVGTAARSSDSSWTAALQLDARYSQLQTAAGNVRGNGHRQLLQDSLQAGIMTPATSYIVLETAEQEAALLAKQKDILAGQEQRASGEPVQMSEPPLIACILLATLIAGAAGMRKRIAGDRQCADN